MINYDIPIQQEQEQEPIPIKNEIIIMNEKKVREFGYIVHNDNNNNNFYQTGYIYPLIRNNDENDENEKYEYMVEGECFCCVECNDDDVCEGEKGKCNKDKNVCVECNEINDCKKNEICSENGRCIKLGLGLCGSSNDCKGENEYCDYNGECKKGCENEKNCKENEICVDKQCRHLIGCYNNFDCNDYDHVCIDNECVVIDENTKSCINQDDCKNIEGSYCNYEYLICVKNKEMVNRRNNEILPTVATAACSLYGVITLYILVSSQAIITNLAKDKLENECDQQCSNNYLMFSKGNVKNHVYSLQHQLDMWNNHDSECTGKCRHRENIILEDPANEAKLFCPRQSFTSIISAEQKSIYLENHVHRAPARNIFQIMLSSFCKNFTYTFWYYYPKSRGKILGQRQRRTRRICTSDLESIKCKNLK